MKVKIFYCEWCDKIKFPDAIKKPLPCGTCKMLKYTGYVEIEVQEVTA